MAPMSTSGIFRAKGGSHQSPSDASASSPSAPSSASPLVTKAVTAATPRPAHGFAFGSRIPSAAGKENAHTNNQVQGLFSRANTSGEKDTCHTVMSVAVAKYRSKRRMLLNPAGDDSDSAAASDCRPPSTPSSNVHTPALTSKSIPMLLTKTSGLPRPAKIAAALHSKDQNPTPPPRGTTVHKKEQQPKLHATSVVPSMTSVLKTTPQFPPADHPDFWKARLQFAESAVQELDGIQYVSLDPLTIRLVSFAYRWSHLCILAVNCRARLAMVSR